MELNPDDPDVRAAVFGEQVEQFLQSDVGVYLMQRADEYAQEAIDGLTRADPEDPKAIRSLQNRIAVADLIAAWLNEAKVMGLQALQYLNAGKMQ